MGMGVSRSHPRYVAGENVPDTSAMWPRMLSPYELMGDSLRAQHVLRRKIDISCYAAQLKIALPMRENTCGHVDEFFPLKSIHHPECARFAPCECRPRSTDAVRERADKLLQVFSYSVMELNCIQPRRGRSRRSPGSITQVHIVLSFRLIALRWRVRLDSDGKSRIVVPPHS